MNVATGGYKVYTTLDPALQRAAVEALVDGTDEDRGAEGLQASHACGARRTSATTCEGAVVAIDPQTGDVRALVGGRNYALAPFNRATLSMRQPGSSFKPFVYAKALEDSLSAATIVPDTALAIPLDNGRVYSPGELRRRRSSAR